MRPEPEIATCEGSLGATRSYPTDTALFTFAEIVTAHDSQEVSETGQISTALPSQTSRSHTRGRKAFFTFSRKRKCRRKWNSIYGRKRNSPDNISFFFFFIHSVTKSALQCAANTSSISPVLQVVLVDGIPFSSCTVYKYLSGIFLDDISTREQFAGLLLPIESSFPQSMHCALLAFAWPNK